MISDKDKRRIATAYGNLTAVFEEDQKETIGFCPEGYAYVNILEDGYDYRVYRCDGGHHVGVMMKKPPHEKHTPNSYILTKDGRLVPSGSAETPTDVPVW